jgi:hypothetical protein
MLVPAAEGEGAWQHPNGRAHGGRGGRAQATSTIDQLWSSLEGVALGSKTLFPDSDQVYQSAYTPITLLSEMQTFTSEVPPSLPPSTTRV